MPDTRAFTSDFARDLRGAAGLGYVRLWFVTMTGAGITPPVRIVSEDGGQSFAAGATRNYKLKEIVDGAPQSNLYYGLPFQITFVNDDGQPPRGRLIIPDIDRRVGAIARAMRTSPKLLIRLFMSTGWDVAAAVDADNAITSLDYPQPIALLDWLKFDRVRGNVGFVEADIVSFDPSREPFPRTRTTKRETPGLYWGS